ncbi:hypothetical protein JOD29_000607 [Lysinibacillus composti]|nr:hypothetical protein [Lysinibacillus composti]MBM7607370.1 hypothetical protein [Lysinibacillus composti]
MNELPSKKEKYEVPLVIYVFFGAGVGAFIGLLTYVKGWLTF